MNLPLNPVNGHSLSTPKLGELLEKPDVVAVEVKLRFNRPMVEKTFQRAKFEDSDFDKDGKVVVTEILRPVKEGETAVLLHVPTKIGFVVDRYECDGVVL